MTLKEFIQGNELTACEVVNDNLIISVVVENTSYGLGVDTSTIPFGTPVVRFTDFTLNGDILTVNNISININDINMLSPDNIVKK